MAWTSQPPELIVPYDPEQRALYEKDDPNSIFFSERWPSELRSGRQRDGRFPEIAVRSSLRALGFSVLISEPRLPHGQGFVLAHYARMRERNHDAYKLICAPISPLNRSRSSTSRPMKRRFGPPGTAGAAIPIYSSSAIQESDSSLRLKRRTGFTATNSSRSR